jgi:hypothetical protein
MTRVAQKDEEIFYLDEFLRNQLGLNVIELGPALKEPPDGSAAITNPDGTTLLLDFEIAEHYVDNPRNAHGGSPSKRVRSRWDRVCAALYPRLETLRLPVDVVVHFKEPISLKNGQIDQFVDELIRFAQTFCPKGHLERAAHGAFSAVSYPVLHECVERITLTHLQGTVVIAWRCSKSAAAFVGVVTSYLSDLVRRKSAKSFTWVNGADKCLLIYASGGTITSRAGPYPPGKSIWDDDGLVSACAESIFDRIYLWERVGRWHMRLK